MYTLRELATLETTANEDDFFGQKKKQLIYLSNVAGLLKVRSMRNLSEEIVKQHTRYNNSGDMGRLYCHVQNNFVSPASVAHLPIQSFACISWFCTLLC